MHSQRQFFKLLAGVGASIAVILLFVMGIAINSAAGSSLVLLIVTLTLIALLILVSGVFLGRKIAFYVTGAIAAAAVWSGYFLTCM